MSLACALGWLRGLVKGRERHQAKGWHGLVAGGTVVDSGCSLGAFVLVSADACGRCWKAPRRVFPWGHILRRVDGL